jgi:hypothetical protein
MKKNIDFELSAEEKQKLKARKISQKMLRDYAPDEIATLLDSSPERTKELNALAEFQSIPSLGIGFARELMGQGYFSLKQMKGKSAVELFDAYERHCGCWADPCVEDSYRLLIHYIELRDENKRWWNFTGERETYREQFGFPADRPATAWYETDKYPKAKANMEDK